MDFSKIFYLSVIFFVYLREIHGNYICEDEHCFCAKNRITCRDINPFELDITVDDHVKILDFRGSYIRGLNLIYLNSFLKLEILDIRQINQVHKRGGFNCSSIPIKTKFKILSDCENFTVGTYSRTETPEDPAQGGKNIKPENDPQSTIHSLSTVEDSSTITLTSGPINLIRSPDNFKYWIITGVSSFMIGSLLTAILLRWYLKMRFNRNRFPLTRNRIYHDINMSILNLDSIQTVDEDEEIRDKEEQDELDVPT